MVKILMIVIYAILFFLHCDSREVDRSEIAGKYLANHDEGVDSLILQEDYKFRLYFHPNDDPLLYKDAGRWLFSDGKASQSILLDDIEVCYYFEPTFHPCYVLAEGVGKRVKSLRVRAFSDKNDIQLVIDSDCGYYYVKQ